MISKYFTSALVLFCISYHQIIYSKESSQAVVQMDETTPLGMMKTVQKEGWFQGCKKIEQHLKRLDISGTSPTSEWRHSTLLKAGCLSESRRDTEAVFILKEALSIDPANMLMMDMLGTSYLRLGRDNEAIDVLKRAIQTSVNYAEIGSLHSKASTAYLRKGGVLQKLEDQPKKKNYLDLAESHIRTAMNLENLPDSPLRYGELGYVKLAKGELEEAIKYFDIAIKKVSNVEFWDQKFKNIMYAEYRMSKGQSYYKLGYESKGIDLMDQAIFQAPTDELKHVLGSIKKIAISKFKSIEEIKRNAPDLSSTVYIPLDE